ncbi:WecB/TagA/CpsF family glycosyltransferase [bacterium]|nr:WecB/TagA/CpsF family glycosyltransferase [bacterium]
MEINNLTVEQFLERLTEFVHSPRTNHIAYVNIDCMNIAQVDKNYARILREADLVYPDGMGVVFASWIFGQPLRERVNAGDLLPEFCRLCVERGYKLFLLGGEPGIAEKAAENLVHGIQFSIVGTRHGYFEEKDSPTLIEEINASGAHILLVGMGAPRQEVWIRRHKEALSVPVAWGVGALFDYYAEKFRAPPSGCARSA